MQMCTVDYIFFEMYVRMEMVSFQLRWCSKHLEEEIFFAVSNSDLRHPFFTWRLDYQTSLVHHHAVYTKSKLTLHKNSLLQLFRLGLLGCFDANSVEIKIRAAPTTPFSPKRSPNGIASKDAHNGVRLKMMTASEALTKPCPAICKMVLNAEIKIPAYIMIARLIRIMVGVAPAKKVDNEVAVMLFKAPALEKARYRRAKEACAMTLSGASGPFLALSA